MFTQKDFNKLEDEKMRIDLMIDNEPCAICGADLERDDFCRVCNGWKMD
jgi:hypothetical protein